MNKKKSSKNSRNNNFSTSCYIFLYMQLEILL